MFIKIQCHFRCYRAYVLAIRPGSPSCQLPAVPFVVWHFDEVVVLVLVDWYQVCISTLEFIAYAYLYAKKLMGMPYDVTCMQRGMDTFCFNFYVPHENRQLSLL